MPKIIDKLEITSELRVKTGMHIGASSDFSPIGAVDSPVIKDPITGEPIIPGSSFKGKLRTLIVKLIEKHEFGNCDSDPDEIKKLFGSSNSSTKTNSTEEVQVYESKLQFYDMFLKNADDLKNKKLDLIYTEIKNENSIDRITLEANPRQIERVPKGAKFNFRMIYNVYDYEKEKEEKEIEKDFNYFIKKEIEKDFNYFIKGIEALEYDYLGGSGSRGYGRVEFDKFNIVRKNLGIYEEKKDSYNEKLNEILKNIKISDRFKIVIPEKNKN